MVEEEEEEETVISKSSPLYSYLLTADSSDDQAAKAEKEALLERIQEDEPVAATTPSYGALFGVISKLLSLFSSFKDTAATSVWRWMNRSSWRSRSDQWRAHTILQLLGSKLLDEDDEAMLRAELEILANRKKDGLDFRIAGEERPKMCKLCYLPMLGAILYTVFRYHCDNNSVFYILDAAAATGAVGSGIQFLIHYRSVRASNSMIALLESCKSADGTFRKALKTIREYEILARGYTVVTKYTVVSNKCSSESDDVAPCLQLRKCALLAAEALFTYFRHRTIDCSHIFGDRIRPVDVDGSFLFAETDELKAMFGEYSKCKNWRISLSVLRTCCYCMTLQRSEFLRVLALGRSDRYVSNRPLTETIDMITKWEETVQRALFYYNSCQLVEDPSSSPRRGSESEASATYDYVHSLGLHLRSALEKTIQIENRISNGVVITSDHADSDSASFDAYCDDVASTLKKCQACLDELQVFLDGAKKTDEHGGEDKPPLRLRSLSEVDAGAKRPAGLIYDGTEPEIVDQVFEAFTSGEYHPESSSSLEDRLDSDNGWFNSGRRHVLDELKSVLTVRSSLMHERELKALAARRGVSVEVLLAEEESQRIKEAEEKRRLDEEAMSQLAAGHSSGKFIHNDATEADVEGRSFASELTRAIQLKGFNRRNREVVLGDDEDEDDA